MARLKMAVVKCNFQGSLFWQLVNFCSYSCKKKKKNSTCYKLHLCLRNKNLLSGTQQTMKSKEYLLSDLKFQPVS
jgi:hypothetical protein